MDSSFSVLGLNGNLLRAVQELGYDEPTPIQKDAIPPALAGRDLLACAMTGSGKTAAFLLPILHRLLNQSRGTTRGLVLAPTRELAAQIEESFRSLAAHTKLTSAAIFGGVSMGPQESAFRRKVDLLVATPGRLLDHLQHPYAALDGIEYLVLDEADRMLDMGFLPDIRRVLARLPKRERQTFFFSATMPGPILDLARELLVKPVTVNIERKAAPATGISQYVLPVREDLKSALLVEILKQSEIKSALVFTRTKHRANRLAEYLTKHGVECDRIHGNRSQAQRTLALSRFKEGVSRVLVATDVAARGIDVEGLSHVINLDVPTVPEDYIHRVGRTARAGALGDAFTFYSESEANELNAIERVVGKRLPRRKVESFDYERKGAERLEIPIGERIKQIRAMKAEQRAKSAEKARLKAEREAEQKTKQGEAARRKAERPQAPARREGARPGQSHGQQRPALASHPVHQGQRAEQGSAERQPAGARRRRSRGRGASRPAQGRPSGAMASR